MFRNLKRIRDLITPGYLKMFKRFFDFIDTVDTINILEHNIPIHADSTLSLYYRVSPY